jgi:hypothetical protein
MLTAPCRRTLLEALFLTDRDDIDQSQVPQLGKLGRWPDHVLRIALWSDLRAGCLDARMITWAATQPWWLPASLSADHGDAVVDAARRVIDASPNFEMRPPAEGDAAPVHDEETSADTAADPSDTKSVAAPVNTMERAAVTTTPAETTKLARLRPADAEIQHDRPASAAAAVPPANDETKDTLTQPAGTNSGQNEADDAATEPATGVTDDVVEPVDDVGAVIRWAASARTTAGDSAAAAAGAAHRVEAAFAHGQAPDPNDVDALVAAARELRRLFNALTSALPGDTAVASLTDVDTSLPILERLALNHAARARIAILAKVSSKPGVANVDSALDTLRNVIDAVVAGTGDDREIDAYLALLELVERAGPNADAAEIVALQQRAAALPPQLLVLPMAAIMGQLTIATETSEGAGDEGNEQAGDATGYLSGDIAGKAASSDAGPGSATEATLGDSARSASAADNAPSAWPGTPAETDAGDQGRASAKTVVAAPAATATGETDDDDLPGRDPTDDVAKDIAHESEDAFEEQVETTVASLVSANRLGLAADIVDASASQPATRGAALRLAALAQHVRTDTSPATSRVRTLLSTPAIEDLGSDQVSLLLSVPALVRVALVTGDPTAGALLTTLVPHLTSHQSAIATQVGQRALQGLLVGNALRSAVADVSDLDDDVRDASAAARDAARPRTLRFKRGTDIAKGWLSTNGLLGTLLTAAACDDRSRLGEVTTELRRLSDHATLAKHLDDDDQRLRGHGSRPIDGPVRQDLYAVASVALDAVSRWADAVAAREAADGAGHWATTELAGMRETVHQHSDAALTELAAPQRSGQPLIAASATHAATALREVLTLINGALPATVADISPDALLTGERLKVPGAKVDAETHVTTLPDDAGLPELLKAAQTSWPGAFEATLQAENFAAADYIFRGCTRKSVPDAEALPENALEQIEGAATHARAELATLHDALAGELRHARLSSELTAERDDELTALLADADTQDHRDLGDVRRQLTSVQTLMPQYRAESARRLTDRLAALRDRGDVAEAEQIERLIAEGNLSTAEELIYFTEIGEKVPKANTRIDLARMFPAVPDALPNGLTRELIASVEKGETLAGCSVLDFGELSGDTRIQTADALEKWRLLATTPETGRGSIRERDLLPALRLAGFDVPASGRVGQVTEGRRRDRRFIDLTDVTLIGKAMVPQFGSQLRGTLRVLLCWGQPAEDLLLSWIDDERSERAVLVAHFGTMSAALRCRLAQRALSTAAPVAVLDDAALAYLAAHGAGQLEAAMAVLMPFAAVQPYQRQKRSIVPPEMFYGRDAERRSVLDPHGTQVIYGGRGLGKSALLRDAKARFEKQPGHVALHLELNATEIGPGRQRADTVWDVLLRDLQALGVVATRGQRGSAHDRVRAGVREWLDANHQRALLIMLDESDLFFEADAPHFLQTNRLKELSFLSGVEGRAKVVFAGLHSVQRFSKVSNQVFKHLAQEPTIIGPLRPQFAFNLITRPLAVLGYNFEREDLVHRILGYCSYQPFLLQMFGHRLVEHLHEHRKGGVGADEPPYVITAADIDAVEDHATLKRDIADTFADTLNLDPRYHVIANVLALHAREGDLDVRLSEAALREECRAYWPTGFDGLDMVGFRTYLQEMAGLGVLAPNTDARGWHLRSPNILRMIGSKQHVEEQLLAAEEEQVPAEFLALAFRRTVGTVAAPVTAPLTAKQIDDVLGDHSNQVRVVLGSPLTGITAVAATIHTVCADLGNRYQLLTPTTRRKFDAELTDGKPGDRRVVLADLSRNEASDDSCSGSLTAALSSFPTQRGVTRAVTIVCGPAQMPFWRELLGRPDADDIAVMLNRFDDKTLRVWALAEDRPFTSDNLRAQLLEMTDGWPSLVDTAARLVAETKSEDEALFRLQEELNDAARAARLLEDSGVLHDPAVAAALEAILSLTNGAAVPRRDLVDAVSLSSYPGLEPEAEVRLLEALEIFDRDSSGNYAIAPLIVASWEYRPLTPAAQ